MPRSILPRSLRRLPIPQSSQRSARLSTSILTIHSPSTSPVAADITQLISPRPYARYTSTLRPHPSPPRLPPAQQAEFERLQRIAASALLKDAEAASQVHAAISTDTAAACREAEGADSAFSSQAIQRTSRNDGVSVPFFPSRHVTAPAEGLNTAAPGATSTGRDGISVGSVPGARDTKSEVSEAKAADTGADSLQGVAMRGREEFEGEVNPKTGEVGGPKREPLRWGAKGDWSYNGRVTDF